MNKILCIIQARMGSTRLPGKVLKEVNGRPMLAYQIARLNHQFPDLDIMLATTSMAADDALESFCLNNNIQYYRGSENDVLGRFADIITQNAHTDTDRIIRITGDCPLICPDLIRALIDEYHRSGAHYGRIDTDTYPRGVDAEIFTVGMLITANNKATSDYEREHVTPYFYQTDTEYKVLKLKNSSGDHHEYRLCVDELLDFEVFQRIIEILGDSWRSATYDDLITLLQRNPDLSKHNQHVQQR